MIRALIEKANFLREHLKFGACIRVWFPKEPRLPTKAFHHYDQSTSANQKHITIDTHAKKQRTTFLIFTPLFALFILAFVDFQVTISMTTWQSAAIYLFIGLITGSLITSPFIKRELKLLREKGEIIYFDKPLMLVISLVVVIAFSGITGFLFSYLSLQTRTIYVNSLFGGILGFLCSSAILIFKWENTYRKRIYGTRDRLYAVSQNENPNMSNPIPELKA